MQPRGRSGPQQCSEQPSSHGLCSLFGYMRLRAECGVHRSTTPGHLPKLFPLQGPQNIIAFPRLCFSVCHPESWCLSPAHVLLQLELHLGQVDRGQRETKGSLPTSRVHRGGSPPSGPGEWLCMWMPGGPGRGGVVWILSGGTLNPGLPQSTCCCGLFTDLRWLLPASHPGFIVALSGRGGVRCAHSMVPRIRTSSPTLFVLLWGKKQRMKCTILTS